MDLRPGERADQQEEPDLASPRHALTRAPFCEGSRPQQGALTGHHSLADEISARFRTLCETHGFAENFDALTGTGLRDRAYTWTASSYLLLAEAHAHRDSR
ncbi:MULTISPECIES: hypothetical protein [unclassified Streptomyces]|uniref:hypothetical protein n=1 Tax=Streptomyces sp. T21Q-yed TaxID=3018441 RepID=UPI00236526B8|nr:MULTISPECIES: hypothetical protein [unclassified Streptomyces]MDF3142831.1 hypothetical protein [Streptomyces sp. T21Q-yed]WDF42845.1 hypothetical protein PBV52_41650 [Streptomyces sp. T12]